MRRGEREPGSSADSSAAWKLMPALLGMCIKHRGETGSLTNTCSFRDTLLRRDKVAMRIETHSNARSEVGRRTLV
jgi:hypothetical protein